MAAIVVGDVLEIIQTWDAPLASVAQNVWHLEMVSGAGGDTADVMAAVLTQQQVAFAAFESRIADDFSVSLLEMRKYDFVLSRFDGVETQVASLMGGTNVSDYEPHGVAGLIRIITANARRQGGTYIPGITDTGVIAGVLDAGVEADLVDYAEIFDTDISVTGAVLSWCTFNTEPLSPVFETTSIAIQAVIANSLPSYLSSRKPGVGL